MVWHRTDEKPLAEPMTTKIHGAIWRHLITVLTYPKAQQTFAHWLVVMANQLLAFIMIKSKFAFQAIRSMDWVTLW